MSGVNSGELTNAELAVLNNLLYMEGVEQVKNKKVSAYVKDLKDKGLENLSNPNDSFSLTVEELNNIFTSIENNPRLSNLTITSPKLDDLGGKMVTFVDQNDNATVVFRGTASDEWPDNLLGAYQTDTKQQKEALDYIKSLPYDNITVSGHSKGGNKSQYVTIVTKSDSELINKIDRCVAFDGQGFSPEFCELYADEIKKYNNIITLISPNDDYVNILLTQIAGNVIYTVPEISFWNKVEMGDFIGLAQEHIQNRMLAFDENGNAYIKVTTTREPIMTILHEFILYLENNVTYEEKKTISNYAAGIVSKLMKGEKIDWKEDIITADGAASAYDIIKCFSGFVKQINPKIGDIIIGLLIKIFINGEKKPNYIAQLKTCFDVIAQEVQTTSTNVLENNSSYTSSFTSSTGAHRDFSESAKQELLSLVREVEDEPFWDVTKWDIWYRAENLFGNLNISNYSNDIKTYQRKLVDINGTTEKNINSIFRNVNEIDTKYKRKIESTVEDLAKLKSIIDEVANSMTIVNVDINIS